MNLKILICDDEKLIREGLASLDWEDHNITVCATAKNGEDAYEKICTFEPDILISDIRMPKRDGIWLAEQVHKQYPHIRMIFLTGYNEFEYAQSAINNNVSRYMLKPIDEDILYNTVEELSEEIIQQRTAKEKEEELRKMLENSRYFLLSYFFNRAESGIVDKELFGINSDIKSITTIVVRIDENNNTVSPFVIFDTIRTLKLENSNIIPFFSNNELVFIMITPLSEKDSENLAFKYCNMISDAIDKNFSADYNIGIGNITEQPENTEYSYNSALRALDYCKSLGTRNILYINDIEPNSQVSSYHQKLLDMYIKSLKNNNIQQLKKNINDIFDSMMRSKMSIYNVQRRCLSLILSISDVLYDLGYNPAVLFNNTDVWSLIRKSETYEDLKQFIINITEVITAHIDEVQRQKNQSLVAKAMELINENYSTDASLESVAAEVFVSPCYLSVIFKKEANITFKNYLINTRIKKAKELLTNTDMKIYEIAEKVGYSDTRYFSELFQRVENITPTQYRTKHTKNSQ